MWYLWVIEREVVRPV